MNTEKAILGAGCFWGIEAEYRQTPGVVSTRVGYSGGTKSEPTYKEVCTGRTGHAEVVEVTFDPQRISFEGILDVFWANHDPTTLNRQGPDVGTQYRSAIFFLDDEQRMRAEKSKEELEASGKLRGPIVTEITPASEFYEAEDYHQQYFEKRGISECRI